MTLVRNYAHDRTHPAEHRLIKVLGFSVAALAGATAVIWGVGMIDQPGLHVYREPAVENVAPSELEVDAQAIYDRYDDCVVNAAAICTS